MVLWSIIIVSLESVERYILFGRDSCRACNNKMWKVFRIVLFRACLYSFVYPFVSFFNCWLACNSTHCLFLSFSVIMIKMIVDLPFLFATALFHIWFNLNCVLLFDEMSLFGIFVVVLTHNSPTILFSIHACMHHHHYYHHFVPEYGRRTKEISLYP